MTNFYTVLDTGQGYLKVTDAEKGVMVGTISLRGKVLTPPVVNQNQCALTVETSSGEKLGVIHQLPSGQLINQYRV